MEPELHQLIRDAFPDHAIHFEIFDPYTFPLLLHYLWMGRLHSRVKWIP